MSKRKFRRLLAVRFVGGPFDGVRIKRKYSGLAAPAPQWARAHICGCIDFIESPLAPPSHVTPPVYYPLDLQQTTKNVAVYSLVSPDLRCEDALDTTAAPEGAAVVGNRGAPGGSAEAHCDGCYQPRGMTDASRPA